jgi:flavodoxin
MERGSAPKEVALMKTALLYASSHGKTKKVIGEVLTRLKVQPDVFNVKEVPDPRPLAAYDLFLFFCPTYGSEELQTDMEDFLARFQLELNGKWFAICELGNYYGYDDYSFGAMRIIRHHLLNQRARELCEPLSLDSFPKVPWDHLFDWVNYLNRKLPHDEAPNPADRDVLDALAVRVGCPLQYRLEHGRCVVLELASPNHIYHGLIRHHTDQEKQEILRLISRLTGLRKLDLLRNRLLRLPPEFAQLEALEDLDLGSNYLGTVPEQIRGFRHLKRLQLGNNNLWDLPPWVGEFRELEVLGLHKNIALKSIDPLAGLKRLRSLNMYLITLSRTPSFLYDLKELNNLVLWNTGDWTDDIARLENLEFLTNCGCPSLRRLPEGVTALTKLRMMRLFQNNLEELPAQIDKLQHLEQLSLYQNQLTALPESFRRLAKLRKLNLAWNQFQVLPTWLGELRSLEWLATFGNPLPEHQRVSAPSAARVERHWPFTTVPTDQVAA